MEKKESSVTVYVLGLRKNKFSFKCRHFLLHFWTRLFLLEFHDSYFMFWFIHFFVAVKSVLW